MNSNHFENVNAQGKRFAIVKSRFNEDITTGLLSGALRALKKARVAQNDVTLFEVPGGFEIPFGVQQALNQNRFDAVITLGCVMKGQTQHHRVIMNAIAQPLVSLSLSHNIPVTLGIIIPETPEQAQARSDDNDANAGYGAAMAAAEMATRVLPGLSGQHGGVVHE